MQPHSDARASAGAEPRAASPGILALSIGQGFGLAVIAVLLGLGVLALFAAWTPLPDRLASTVEHFTRPGFNVLGAGLAKAAGLAAVGALPLLPLWLLTRLAGALHRRRSAKRRGTAANP